MNDTPHFSQLAQGHCNTIVPPSIEMALTGVLYARQRRNGDITLTYTDRQTTETRPCKLDMCREFSSFMGIVMYVQEGR